MTSTSGGQSRSERAIAAARAKFILKKTSVRSFFGGDQGGRLENRAKIQSLSDELYEAFKVTSALNRSCIK